MRSAVILSVLLAGSVAVISYLQRTEAILVEPAAADSVDARESSGRAGPLLLALPSGESHDRQSNQGDGTAKPADWSRWPMVASVDQSPPASDFRTSSMVSDGWHTDLHPDGTVEAEGEYRLGQKEGVWRYYSESGQRVLEGIYERGEASGTWLAWHEDGRLRARASCVRGRFHGHCRFWSADGTLDEQQSGLYKDGVLTRD